MAFTRRRWLGFSWATLFLRIRFHPWFPSAGLRLRNHGFRRFPPDHEKNPGFVDGRGVVWRFGRLGSGKRNDRTASGGKSGAIASRGASPSSTAWRAFRGARRERGSHHVRAVRCGRKLSDLGGQRRLAAEFCPRSGGGNLPADGPAAGNFPAVRSCLPRRAGSFVLPSPGLDSVPRAGGGRRFPNGSGNCGRDLSRLAGQAAGVGLRTGRVGVRSG